MPDDSAPPFQKILVANRSEIAIRVFRSAHELGIRTVAIYSHEDRFALHRFKADESYRVGRVGEPIRAYIDIAGIVALAKQHEVEAIHPGYGFLSENPQFARACRQAGITFIGPSPAAMELMGSKTRARQQMEKAGLPFVPGTSRGMSSLAEAQQLAAELGYPIMLKAAAGGGGKGMRLARDPSELASAFDTARSEALGAFGDDEVYLEKAIPDPRHVEIQILADEYGNTVYLGERDCSLQRRHQKVLEESPAPAITPKMRQEMGAIAVK